MKKSLFFMIVTLLLLPSIVIAQAIATTCPDIVTIAIQAADELCEGLERNSICYGNFKLDATPQEGVDNFYFERVGDIAHVNDLARLEMSPMKEDAGEWGVAVMALQANLPNTLPGQNVTFILFGDVTLENATTPEQVENGEFSPMQAFYLTTGIGESNCAEAPESGMLVQTPKGVGEVNFVVNGVEIAMGSTVFFQAPDDTQLTATTVEGSAVLTVDEKSYPVLAGTRFGVSLLEEEFLSTPNFPESYQDDVQRLAVLPLNLLEREINIHPPFDGAMLEMLRGRIENEQPLCGEAPFPPCNELPAILGGETCVFPENYEDNLVPLEIATRPICEASIFFDGIRPPNNEVIPPINPPVDNRTCIMRPGPESPPLPANETRPFCEDLGTPPPPATDNYPCVVRPDADDPPLSADETRPFCDDIGMTPPPPPSANLLPPLATLIPTLLPLDTLIPPLATLIPTLPPLLPPIINLLAPKTPTPTP